ncbi:CHP1784-containing protein [Crocosphaera subtropica ATCC 51142]|uniref:CHP1784-containing protein n=1 Tax=Crocosphaera subtropica (strain ATCC 51142 / BH68) TaxID=43989 RepID=B1WSP5_CROS5|nr:DUF2887 domain-containing protein [Crocosphaera subtropica]ACB53624.1 CHP1784-containing protein [Crocosphaera subtropica ATCC 51142]
MKTDTIFYRLFQSFPSIFFELIQFPATEANSYCFDSVEIKQLSFRIDGVFLPKNNNLNTPIYFCKVQFQKDDNFYGRFFAEIFLYLSKTNLTNDWRGVIIYPNRQVEGRQEGREEGRLDKALETVPRLLALGLTVEQVAEALELDIEQVRNIQKKEGF